MSLEDEIIQFRVRMYGWSEDNSIFASRNTGDNLSNLKRIFRGGTQHHNEYIFDSLLPRRIQFCVDMYKKYYEKK